MRLGSGGGAEARGRHRGPGEQEDLIAVDADETRDDEPQTPPSNRVPEGEVTKGDETGIDASATVAEQYFDAWNRRDVDPAASLFANDCDMRDLQYNDAFSSQDQLRSHLERVESCLPSTFNFVVDDLAASSNKVGVAWHVENDGAPLAFTQGCSFYALAGQIKERTTFIMI